jgi:hypothetical protein
LVGQMQRGGAHAFDEGPHVGRDDVRRVAPPGRVRDVDGQCAHAVQVGDDPQGADHGAQVPGDRGLQGQQGDGDVLSLGSHVVKLDVHGDDLFGEGQVGVE